MVGMETTQPTTTHVKRIRRAKFDPTFRQLVRRIADAETQAAVYRQIVAEMRRLRDGNANEIADDVLAQEIARMERAAEESDADADCLRDETLQRFPDRVAQVF